SRSTMPKQFLSIVSEKTMIADTVERLSKIASPEHIFIATALSQADLVKKHLPGIDEKNIISEPALRNTAPCIGLSAYTIRERFPDEDTVVGVFPADHVIRDLDVFEKTIEAACNIALEKGLICQIGIAPTFPSTGYGYIHRGELLESAQGIDIYDVLEFREKPGLQTAEEYLETGEYYWNGGMFIFKPEVMIGEFEKHLPQMHKGLEDIFASGGEKLGDIYPELEKISIDYGIIERTDKRCVAEARFYWDDVGAWDAVGKYFEQDEDRNVVKGTFFGEDCDECVIFNKSSLAVTGVGLDEMIVVVTDDAVLICPKERVQGVKQIVNKLKQAGRNDLV
ncbi:mannose-1-phosphate guanylyltransferase, partial [Planctomycetota bacterium]